jgi:acetate kinase
MKNLIINTGSASKKYSVYNDTDCIYTAHFETENELYIVTEFFDDQKIKTEINYKIFQKSLTYILDSLLSKNIITSIKDISTVGIRIVAPGEYFLINRIIDKEYLTMIKKTLEKVPLHLKPTLSEIQITKKIFKNTRIIGISDSAFHKNLPERAKYYAIPIADSRKLGLQKFGYHGISIQSVLKQVKNRLDILPSKIVICHLGGGASVTAIKDGQSIDTSMGFTPLDGLVMATRVGEIDPGAAVYLANKLKLNMKQLEEYFNSQCGLLGLSGRSSDIRELLKYEAEGHTDSSLALKVYANRLKKYIGGTLAILGGVDLLVFTGTVGERSFAMRERICQGLDFLGIEFDKDINDKSEGVEAMISRVNSKIKVLVIKTDEMQEMAEEVLLFINN